MNDFKLKLASTIISENNYEWRPSNFQNLLIEIAHLQETINESLLYRGHRKSDWLLDSTIARSFKEKQNILITDRYPDFILDDVNMQHQLAKQYLQKMNKLILNSELQKLEKQGVDTYFEFFRHQQQNPKDSNLHDIEPYGTCFIDFTQNWKVGLFFANFNRILKDEGALFVVRQTALGDVLQRVPFVDKLFELERQIKEKPNEMYGHLPLLIFPEKPCAISAMEKSVASVK